MILQFSKSFIDSWVCWHSLFDAFVTSKQCPHLNHGRHRQQGLRRTFLSCSQSLGSLVPEPYCSQRKARSWWYTLTGEWVSALPMYPELGDPELGFCWQCDHQSLLPSLKSWPVLGSWRRALPQSIQLSPGPSHLHQGTTAGLLHTT